MPLEHSRVETPQAQADAAPIIELADLSLTRQGRPLLRDFSWSLWPGENWAVIGPNGAGKTMFMRLAAGELWPDPDAGRRVYRLDGQTGGPLVVKSRLGSVSLAQHVDYLRQERDIGALDVVLSGFSGCLRLYGEPAPDQLAAARALLDDFGLGRLHGRPLHAMSLGQGRKVLLARALVRQPRLLFLDEALDGLDAASRAFMLERLDRFAAQGGQFVMTAHRAEDLSGAVNRVLRIEAGRAAWQGPTAEAPLSRPRAEGAVASRPPVVPSSASSSSPASSSVTDPAATAALPSPATSSAEAVPPSTATAAGKRPDWLARLENVSVRRAGQDVLSDVSWTVRPGQIWRVGGPNGSGKSTLLRLLAGDLHPLPGGRVLRFGRPADRPLTLWELRRRIGLVSGEFQAGYHHDLPAEDVVASGFFGSIGLWRTPDAAQRAQARRLLARVSLDHKADQPFLSLSSGEQRRAVLARALVHDPDLLLLDEPCAGLDPDSRLAFLDALVPLAAAGQAVVLVSHYPDDVPPGARRLILAGGRVVEKT